MIVRIKRWEIMTLFKVEKDETLTLISEKSFKLEKNCKNCMKKP